MSSALIGTLERALADRAAAGLARARRIVDSPPGPRVILDGREFVAFASNDYLGLANHPALVAAVRDAASRCGVGAGASHPVSGHFRAHESAAGEWLAAALPNRRFAAIAGVAHVPFLSHPAEFGAALGAFLDAR